MSEDYAKTIVWKLRCKNYTKLYETTRKRCDNYPSISKKHPENYTENYVKAMQKNTHKLGKLYAKLSKKCVNTM